MNLQDPNYDPNGFIDWLRELFEVKSDAKLARAIELNPAQISLFRRRKLSFPLHAIVRVHEVKGLGTLDIKARMFKPAADADAAYVRQAA
jgi:hypothetical protein